MESLESIPSIYAVVGLLVIEVLKMMREHWKKKHEQVMAHESISKNQHKIAVLLEKLVKEKSGEGFCNYKLSGDGEAKKDGKE